ncbi:MAG TPA: ATP-binding protein [Polyangiales bacterium]|nr:ATP-binding protein [Polyangiales bacterium]
MLDALLEGFQVIGFDFRYLVVNAAAARHGRSSADRLTGRTIMACYPGIDETPMFARLKACLEQRSSHVLENYFRFPDGSGAWFELRIEPVPQGACVLSIDISERKAAEASLRSNTSRLHEAERMEALGLLAAGIAHEFNNVLGVMLGIGETSLARAEGPVPADVEGMMSAAQRATELTNQLLAYGRKQQLRSEVLDPAALIERMEATLRRTIPGDIELRLRVTPPLGHVEVDPAQLEKVVRNLVHNARDALPKGGLIAIELSELAFDADYVRLHPGTHEGRHVMIAVSDTGSGMDVDTQARIFQPFFSTKDRGGSGLGLSTVWGIVKQSGGHIWVYSEPGHGTSFKVYLPSVPSGESPRSSRPPAPASVPAAPLAPQARVLVAEDDALLRTLAEHTLQSAGYQVKTARSGDQALAMLKADEGILVLITDVVMPGLRGPELIVQARLVRPELKVLCTSGYALSALEDHKAQLANVAFLDKPYLPSSLVKAVRGLFEA